MRNAFTQLRSDVDSAAALVRLGLASAVLIYLLLTERDASSLLGPSDLVMHIAIAYFCYALCLLLSNIIWPGPLLLRRAGSVLVDTGVITVAMILSGETATPFFGGYLWATIANGLRYGRGYLYVTNVFSVIGFTTVLLVSPFWQGQPILGIGLLVWLILLPGYVSALLVRLESALDKARMASTIKSQFLANMSHELRTPLNAIIGYSEILQEDARAGQQTQTAEDLEKIHSSANHLLSLINNILDLSKIEAGKMPLYCEHFNLRELIDESIAAVSPLAAKKHNRIELTYAAPLTMFYSDRIKLKQALLNLLGNANKFTDSGRISINVHSQYPGQQPELVITITDTGIGISPEKISQLFKPFEQADSSTTRKFGGTGLGLTLTKNFIELLGGAITAHSALGEGSTFQLILPIRSLPDEKTASGNSPLPPTMANHGLLQDKKVSGARK